MNPTNRPLDGITVVSLEQAIAAVGQHSHGILREMGRDAAEIARLEQLVAI